MPTRAQYRAAMADNVTLNTSLIDRLKRVRNTNDRPIRDRLGEALCRLHHGGTLPRKWDSADAHDGFEQWWRGSADRMLSELLPDAGIEVVAVSEGRGMASRLDPMNALLRRLGSNQAVEAEDIFQVQDAIIAGFEAIADRLELVERKAVHIGSVDGGFSVKDGTAPPRAADDAR